MERNYLFLCGCARSGTSGLTKVLNSSPDVVMGMERFLRRFNQTGTLTPDLFEKERFFTIDKDDTFKDKLGTLYKKMPDKIDAARYRGDKIPRLYRSYGMLRANFPGCRIITIVRNIFDVAASFQTRSQKDPRWSDNRDAFAAVSDWNESLGCTTKALGPDHLVVMYENLFVRGIGWDQVSAFLGVKIKPPTLRDATPGGSNVLSIEQKEYILLEAKIKLYRELAELSDGAIPEGVTRRPKRKPNKTKPGQEDEGDSDDDSDSED